MSCEGEDDDSRAGDVLSLPFPVTTSYSHPEERVLFDENRDCNPFFHLMESLWMLGGRRDLKFVQQFNKKMANFSDDNKIFHGAYGFRWRVHFAYDQLEWIIEKLRKDPRERRIVLQIWDPIAERNKFQGKDLPCNTQIYFRIVHEELDMTVCNRSNDMLWGAYGANMVHMSMLQEYMAGRIDVGIGTYYQISNNFHVYTDIWDKLAKPTPDACLYAIGAVKHYPIMNDPNRWDYDLQAFLTAPENYFAYNNRFFSQVAKPIFRTWALYKQKSPRAAWEFALEAIQASDWRCACVGWLERRMKRREVA